MRIERNMKKVKAHTTGKISERAAKGKSTRKAADLASIREQIANLVGSEAVGMVTTTIAEVEKGHYLALKYLFEMIGLYPAAGADETPGEAALAKTLLRRLGIPEEATPVELKLTSLVTKDTDADPTANTNDALE
jgi:hypothetical protein